MYLLEISWYKIMWSIFGVPIRGADKKNKSSSERIQEDRCFYHDSVYLVWIKLMNVSSDVGAFKHLDSRI